MAKAKTAGSPRKKRRVTTVYMDVDVSRAAKMKAALTGMSVSDQVNRALLRDLHEDERDLRIFKERAHEPTRDYDEFLAEMKRDGRI
jgi:hypothetical protein